MSESTMKNFGWAYLELMGHRTRVGRAQEEEIAGGVMLRIDIPTDGEDFVTEYYGTSSIYALRPVSEEVARNYYGNSDPRPARPLDYRDPPQLTSDDVPDFE